VSVRWEQDRVSSAAERALGARGRRRRRRAVLRAAGALALVLAAGCSDGAAEAAGPDDGGLRGRLTVTGSSTCAPLVGEIARRFEALHAGVRIDVQTGGSSRGIADVGTGLADVGMSSRALADAEREGRRSHVFARDGVGFLVHASNPVRELSDEQLVAVYTGAVTRWSELGGVDAEITVIDRADGRSELDLVTELLDLERDAIAADVVAGENQQGIKQVATDPHAITYMSVGSSELERRRGTPIALLPLRGVEASSATVADGRYPLVRPLILITGAAPGPLAAAFVAYARSAAVDDLVREQGFVPLAR